nr:GDCCVxC domain-containing (seleno)protein [Polynucleobacter sp. MWH-Braz-FAM2G]
MRLVNINIEQRYSNITCPHCLATESHPMPLGSSMHLYRCGSCNNILKPKSGDCCIYCSFGDMDCSSPEQNLAA